MAIVAYQVTKPVTHDTIELRVSYGDPMTEAERQKSIKDCQAFAADWVAKGIVKEGDLPCE